LGNRCTWAWPPKEWILVKIKLESCGTKLWNQHKLSVGAMVLLVIFWMGFFCSTDIIICKKVVFIFLTISSLHFFVYLVHNHIELWLSCSGQLTQKSERMEKYMQYCMGLIRSGWLSLELEISLFPLK
jgi:hypothetical protein